MTSSRYDLTPFVPVPGGESACVAGWVGIAERLQDEIRRRGMPKTLLVVECYPGVDEALIFRELSSRLQPSLALRVNEALRPPGEIDALVEPFLGQGDPVFGRLSDLQLAQFYDHRQIALLRSSGPSARVRSLPF